VHPYHAKKSNVKAIAFLLLISIVNINGLKKAINKQNKKVVITISNFCSEDK
jgi:hypothetical protein